MNLDGCSRQLGLRQSVARFQVVQRALRVRGQIELAQIVTLG